MLNASPFLPNKDENGDYHYAIPWEGREANPIGKMDYVNGNNLSKSHTLQGNIFATIQPISGLKIRSSFGYTFSANNYRRFVPAYRLASNVLKIVILSPRKCLWEAT